MMRKKIMVNTQFLISGQLDGLGRFAFESLKRIVKSKSEIDFIFVFDRKYNEKFLFAENIKPVILNPPSRHPLLWYLKFQHVFPSFINKHQPDLFFSPDGWIPLKTSIPIVDVIHDINFEYYPKDLPFLVSKYYKHFFPLFAQKADRLATVSQYSKNDLVSKYKIPAEKIDVVYNGCNELYEPLSEQEITSVRNKFTNGKPYFLFIGSMHPRKNMANLFKAYDNFKKSDASDLKLLIVGHKMYWTSEISNAFESMKFKDEVVFTGHVPSAELKNILGAAHALTYVSYFEGFGIPIVEAFNAGIPVVTSNVTSMPEVAGDAALLIDPFSVESISNAMTKIANDENLRKSLIDKGNLQKLKFSWDKTADLLWNCISTVLYNKKTQ